MREARESAGLTQAALSRRLAELHYTLSRSQIADLESEDPDRRRRATVDDLLAIAAALDVAPLHLLVPFEDEEVLSEDAADAGIFPASANLQVGKLSLLPSEARRWITGRQIYLDADLASWERYYTQEVPPARRWRVREWRRLLTHERRLPEQKPDDRPHPLRLPSADDVEPRMLTGKSSLPTWVWIALRGQDPPDWFWVFFGEGPESSSPNETAGQREDAPGPTTEGGTSDAEQG